MLATLKEVLEKAEQGNYAVGAFNCTSLESGMAIVETAEELNSPVILQYADSHRHLIFIDVIGPIMLQLAKIAKVPVVVHLDHGASIESCRHAVDMGFTSVMYDASAKPFEDNVAETRSVVEYAHERGASVEAELGHILTSKAGAAEGNGKSYTREEAYTDPEMAKEFIERTNVDALAIGFGTAHGIYTEKPVLDLNRIALIKSAKDIPYVMHGGSGLSEEEYRTAIHNGIRKINYYTYLSLAGGRGVMQYLEDKKDKDAIYFEDIAKAGITVMKADVKRAMKIFESDGKI